MQTQLLQEGRRSEVIQVMVFTAAAAGAAAATAGSGEDVHTALNPVLDTDPSVCISTVMVSPKLVKGPGMELPR